MRHRIYGKQLCRDSEHRRAMLRNLAAGLFEHGEIETTLPKARAVQPFVEKIITLARKGTFSARRQIEARINDRKIHSWVADPDVPDMKKDNPYFDLPDASDIQFNRYGEVRKAPRLVQHIMTNIAPMFEDRDGGYTRIIRTGRHRLGDGSDIVLLQFVGREEGPEIGGGTSRRREQADKRTAFAARLRKGEAKEEIEEEVKDEAAPAEEEPAAATAVAEPETEPEAPDVQDPADEEEEKKD
ncbi:MAG: 50S ribosomal protein L17 [Phycisphaerales bacterium]|nr:MAG: 50S ribosomal protein L17 [Phycisphaerales bacterium]